MKILFKSILIIIAVSVLFSFTACNESKTSTKNPTNFKTLAFKDEQIYLPNDGATKISKLFEKFTGDSILEVTVGILGIGYKPVGTGDVKKGLLSFNAGELLQSDLIDSGTLFHAYFSGESNVGGWYDDGNNVRMNPADAKSNIVTLIAGRDENGTPNKGVIKEGFNGNQNSLSGEYIYYIYTDRDCTISAMRKEYNDISHVYVNFSLNLKKGWNTLCKTETYTTNGISTYTMELKNPDLRWLILDL
ncbi:MAG: hypothetical protein FWC19_00680 [Treponema sp.]|nr:hypothetical protein [Treponema sp.]MCL2271306.1 hypothetical protein [Treponema sp.]